MDTERICPSCQKPLPPGAPKGLCPECLMKAGFGTGIAAEPGQPSKIPTFVPPPVADLAKLFPQFEILELLGQGGMGAVYKARQPALDRFVALKILPPETSGDAGFADRFTREARALARLNHPNIVAVHEFGQAGGLHYFVMEYVEGINLRQLEQAGKLSPREALKIIPQICDALQFAHDEGIVHRDIKPENVMLDTKGRVKITDFGLAKILGLEPDGLRLTGAKDVMGTPHYMAPEQIEHPQEVDHRADIYSLGVVFYEMLTGELPVGKFQPPSQKVHVDVRLDEVVLRTLEKEPERRYQKASEVKTQVESIASTPALFAPSAAVLAPDPTVSDKIILPAFLLAFFFGVFGMHRFYVGKVRTGLLQLGGLLAWIPAIVAIVLTGITVGGDRVLAPMIVCLGLLLGFLIVGCCIWATVDWIVILCKAFTDGQGRRITNWLHPGRSNWPPPPAPQKPPARPNPPAGQARVGAGPVAAPPPGTPADAPTVLAATPEPDPLAKAQNVIKVLGVLSLLVGGFGLLCCSPLNFSVGLPLNLKQYADQPTMAAWLLIAAIVSSLLAGGGLVGGIGLWKFKSWGRKVVVYKSVCVCVLDLLGIPIVTSAILGQTDLTEPLKVTALAVYGFITLLFLAYEAVLIVCLTRKPIKLALREPDPDNREWLSLAAAALAFALVLGLVLFFLSKAEFIVRAAGPSGRDGAAAAATNSFVAAQDTAEVSAAASGATLAEAPDAGAARQTNAAAAAKPIQRTVTAGSEPNLSKSFALGRTGRLVMDVDRGGVHVVGTDQDTVEVHVTRDVRRATAAQASQVLAEEKLVLKQTASEVSISAQDPRSLHGAWWWGRPRPELDVNYEITVPRKSDLRLKTAGGAVKVASIHGGMKVNTLGGDLAFNDVEGKVDGGTMGGGIHAAGYTDELLLHTMGGGIRIETFSGPSVRAHTAGGSVSADFASAPKADCELHTMGGSVTARLPETSAVTVDASTIGGTVRTDLPVQVQGHVQAGKLRGTLNGGGPLLKLETLGGSIELRKRAAKAG